MKTRIALLLMMALNFAGCGFSDWDTFMGNPKHVCDYKEYASATVRNLSSRTVQVLFCGKSRSDLKMGGDVVNDGAQHDFNVLVDQKHDEYHDSAPETCSNKGIPSGTSYDKGYFASLPQADLAVSQLCLNHHGDVFDNSKPDWDREMFIVMDRGALCPNGFQAYDQSTNPCTP